MCNLAGFTEFVLSRMFSVEVGTVSRKLEEAANAARTLRPRFVQMPMGAEADRVARGFAALRRGRPCLDNVIGALDGTFIFVMVPETEHGRFMGYKHPRPALLLMGACDHNLKFRWYSAESVASIGDQAATTKSDLAASSSSASARAAAACGPYPRGPPTSALDATLAAGLAPEMVESVQRKLQDLKHDTACRPVVPLGKVLVCDGGVQDYDWMLRVGNMHDLKAVKRLTKPIEQRRQLEKLAYCNFVISSHRIHIERAFGRFFNSFKIFRGGRFSEDKMLLFLDAAMVAYNFIITDLEVTEASAAAASTSASSDPAPSAAAAASSAAPAVGLMAQPAVACLDDDTETLAVASKALHEVSDHISDMGTTLLDGPPVMALVHSEASKATAAYVREMEAAGLPLVDERFTVSIPDTEDKVHASLAASTAAVGECVAGMKLHRQRRFIVMEAMFAARADYAAITGVLDADSRVKQASANMSKAAHEAEAAAMLAGAAAAATSTSGAATCDG